MNQKINPAFAGQLLLFANPFDEFFYDYLYRTYGPKLPEPRRGVFHEILAHCRASKVDLENPEPHDLQLTFDVPEWIRATYPLDMVPFQRQTPIEYTYLLDWDVREAALRTKARLERQGANLDSIAERIFMEVPAVHRARTVVRRNFPRDVMASEELEQRMTWAG